MKMIWLIIRNQIQSLEAFLFLNLASLHKEITYLLLARRTSRIDPIERLSKLGYDYPDIGKTLKLSYQTISSPIIYCKHIKNRAFIDEIEFFPPENKYYFCNDKDLSLDFIKSLIMKYNEIIAMDIKLIDKIENFRSSLIKLIQHFQKIYKRKIRYVIPVPTVIHTKVPIKRKPNTEEDDFGVSKKQHIKSDNGPSLPNDLMFRPFDGDVDEIYPDLSDLEKKS